LKLKNERLVFKQKIKVDGFDVSFQGCLRHYEDGKFFNSFGTYCLKAEKETDIIPGPQEFHSPRSADNA